MNQDLPPELERERLKQLPPEELVKMMIGQAIAFGGRVYLLVDEVQLSSTS
jgi:hypothetical protein